MKKSLLLLVLTLLMSFIGMSAVSASQTLTIDSSKGTFYKDGTTALTPSSTAQYGNKWMSTSTSPQLTLSCVSNNMVVDNQFRIHTDTYTLEVDEGFQITGYSIEAYSNYTGTSTITPSGGSAQTISTSSSNPTTVVVSNVNSSLTTFAVSTGNPWIVITSFTVTIAEPSTSITSGHIYRLQSYYTDLSMTAMGNKLSSVTTDNNSYGQLWKITKSDSRYTFQNVLTDAYIQSNTSTSTQWTLGSTACNFAAHTKTVDGNTWFSFSNTNSTWYGLHTAKTQNYYVVGWDYTADASYWMLEEVTLTSAQQEELAEIKAMTSTDYTSALSTFFSDNACTTLKSNYASMTDAQLRSAMSSLPSTLQEMAVRVKNDTWNSDATWNSYEKDFRIHEYEIYSNCNQWSTVTGTGPFAHLFNPTGIQAKAGDALYIFVDSDVKDSDATLEAELVVGTNRTGTTTTLHAGYNAIYVNAASELFISYLLNNTSKSCNDYPNIKIHVEGATCNGCFDMHRGHDNSDWAWLKSNMFSGKYLHVKGESVLLNVLKDEVIGESNATGVMKIWDFVFDKEQSLAGCDQWKNTGQYKMMINSFHNEDGGNPHWGSGHGTSHPSISSSSLFKYSGLANVGTYGGSLWEITHEMGHGHQAPINCAGMTEKSNNSLAQAVNFLAKDSPLFESTRSSRAQGVKEMAAYFNEETRASWMDIAGDRVENGLWLGNRFYFRLWLYFDYLGNYQPSEGNTGFSFMTALYDKLRANGIVKSRTKTSPSPSTKDFLLVAKYAAEITQTDLSEFFDAWGFWQTSVKVANDNDDASTNTWYFGDYGDIWVQTTEEMANSVRSAMKQYTKKGGNIMFIEDRGVGSTLPTYNGSASSTFGDVGYYETYGGSVTGTYKYTVSNGSKVTISGDGTGAVGFKVYDDEGNLVAISNTKTFTVRSDVATGLASGAYRMVAAQGDGNDVAVPSTGAKAITYILKYEGTEVGRVENVMVIPNSSTEANMPEELKELGNFGDWMSYTYSPTTTTTSTTIVNVTATWNGPFELSSDYEHAIWYNLKLKDETYPTYVSDGTPNVTLPTKASVDDTQRWAFIGNPYTGLTIINKAAGRNLKLVSDKPTGDGGSTYATIKSSGANELWIPKVSTFLTNGFYLYTTSCDYALNKRSNANLAFWNGADKGSTFVVEEIPDNWAEHVIRDCGSFFSTDIYDTYFTIPLSVKNEWQTRYEAYSVSATEAQYKSIKEAVEGSIKYPETGKYRIKSCGVRDNGTPTYIYCENDVLKTSIDPDASVSTFTFTGEYPIFKLSVAGKNVQIFPAAYSKPATVSDDEGNTIVFSSLEPGYCVIDNYYGQLFFHEDAYHNVVGWVSDAAASKWMLEKASVLGDVNGDGQVSIADVTALVNIILGKDNTQPYQYDHDAADVNGDGSTSIADVTALVNIILGKN